MNKFFPTIEPYKIEFLQVTKLHKLYIEQSGNPTGKPILGFHGGPGSSQSKPDHRRFYNSQKYRIILFDQRGCGKSTPRGETKENTTQDLVDDVEKIRKYLNIKKWVIHGGSWGSTLAIAYAEKYPQYVKALVLAGIFTFRRWEVEWTTRKAKLFFPDNLEKITSTLPNNLKQSINDYLYNLYMGKNSEKQLETIKALNIWNRSLTELIQGKEKIQENLTTNTIAGKKILYHYIKHNGFLKEGELLNGSFKIRDIPAVIIQGRYDMCCPPITAWELHRKLPKADFYIIPSAGHKSDEPGILEKIIEYTNKFSLL